MKKSGLLKRKIVGKELSSEQPAEKEEKPVLWGEAVCSQSVGEGPSSTRRACSHYGWSPPSAPTVSLLSEYFIAHLTEKNNWTVK